MRYEIQDTYGVPVGRDILKLALETDFALLHYAFHVITRVTILQVSLLVAVFAAATPDNNLEKRVQCPDGTNCPYQCSRCPNSTYGCRPQTGGSICFN